MKEIIIIPHIGIGQLKLGMTSDELENALLQMKKQWSNSSDEAMQMERCAETGDPNLITGRYMDCLLYTSPSPRDVEESRMPSSA